MLLIQLLTVPHVVIHIGNKGYIHGNLKDCNFKTSKNPWNQHIVYLQGKTHETRKSPFTPNIYIPTFNELMIKNTHVKK